jgi:hypothetical protein
MGIGAHDRQVGFMLSGGREQCIADRAQMRRNHVRGRADAAAAQIRKHLRLRGLAMAGVAVMTFGGCSSGQFLSLDYACSLVRAEGTHLSSPSHVSWRPNWKILDAHTPAYGSICTPNNTVEVGSVVLAADERR